MKILLLEDEYLLSRSIRIYLLSCGYLVDYYDNGVDVLAAIKNEQHDFYILDINTPLVGGLDCLSVISKKYPDTPKIMISAYNDIEYISNAFDLGCSDYLKKPFNLKELQLRIERLLLKQTALKEAGNHIVKLSEHYTFNKDTNFLYYDHEMQNFTKKELALLHLFINNIGQLVTDETIQSTIYNNEEVEPSTIRSLVNRIRSKLKEEIIQNIRGFGYIISKV